MYLLFEIQAPWKTAPREMRETESIGEPGVCSLISFIHLLPKEKWKEWHPAEQQYCWNFSDDNSRFLLSLNRGELIRHSRPSLKWGQKATLCIRQLSWEYLSFIFPNNWGRLQLHRGCKHLYTVLSEQTQNKAECRHAGMTSYLGTQS